MDSEGSKGHFAFSCFIFFLKYAHIERENSFLEDFGKAKF